MSNSIRLHRQPGGARGFTIFEMLVAGMVGVIVLCITVNSFQWFSRSLLDLRIQSRLGRELKSATDAIAQDHGGALASRTLDGASIQFNHDGSPFERHFAVGCTG